MTLPEFYGCTFLAFGPPLAMFMFTIAHDPIRIIILIAAAFVWLLSLLLSSLLWFAIVPLRDVTSFALIFSVLFQVGGHISINIQKNCFSTKSPPVLRKHSDFSFTKFCEKRRKDYKRWRTVLK